MIFNPADIENMSKEFGAHFVNSLPGYKSANLLASVDDKKRSNLAIVSSVIHLGSRPALMGYINRPHSVPRHSLENIINNKYYSFNHIKQTMVDAAHQTSARYPGDISEFEATGLQEQWLADFPVPFVAESAIKIGMRYVEHHTLLNQTVLVIGSVELVEVADELIRADGSIDIMRAGTVTVSGLDTYSNIGGYKRLSYAKVDKIPTVLAHKKPG